MIDFEVKTSANATVDGTTVTDSTPLSLKIRTTPTVVCHTADCSIRSRSLERRSTSTTVPGRAEMRSP